MNKANIFNKVFKYNDFEGVFDFSDYVQLERRDAVTKEYLERLEAIQADEDLSDSEKIREMFENAKELWNGIFNDPSAGDKILGSATSFTDVYNVTLAFNEFEKDQYSAMKAMSGSNRSARRAKKKAKR